MEPRQVHQPSRFGDLGSLKLAHSAGRAEASMKECGCVYTLPEGSCLGVLLPNRHDLVLMCNGVWLHMWRDVWVGGGVEYSLVG